jgi:tetratricopeptide (TPR) repeat protein
MKIPIEKFRFRLKANPRARLFCLVLVLFGSRWNQPAWSAEEVWNRPSFSVAPAELASAASAIPGSAGNDYMILLDEVKYVFAKDGTYTRSSHMIFRILTAAGAKSWTTVESPWRMWREEKPQIRARVIAPDGVTHALDPKTINEAPVDDEQPDLFTDLRLVHAPLPAIDVGSVIEQEIVVPGKKSLLSNGSVHSEDFGNSAPTHRARIRIDAPAGLHIQFQTFLMDSIKPRRTESGNKTQLVFEGGPLAAFKAPEPFLPPDAPRMPQVIFSTGKSWQDVITHYNQILEPQIRIAEVESFVARANIAGKSRHDIIAALLALLQHEIRYTGVEFGNASWVPRTPAETLQRKYGDCKDKSALMVAMLRSAGIPAHLALLTASSQHETLPGLPGLGRFDHAIVFVPGSPDTWIDVTSEYSKAGQLPTEDQGRLALIVRPETSDLVRTPESGSKDNRQIETREFFLQEIGPARIVETTEAFGSIEEDYRSSYALMDPKEAAKQFREYGRDAYLAKEPSVGTFSAPEDLSAPFRLRIEMPKANRGITNRRDAAVAIFVSQIADRLPRFDDRYDESPDAAESDAATEKKAPIKRKGELLLPESFVNEWHYKIVPPPGYKARPLPQSARSEIGPALLISEYSTDPNGVIHAVFRFDTRKRRLASQEADDLIAGLKTLRKQEAILLTFDQTGEVLLEEGKIRQALAEFRRLSTMHAQEALHRSQIARALLLAGIGETAREEARRAVAMEPKSALAFDALAEVLEYDLIGRRFKKGMDLEGAIEARRKSIELDPEDPDLKLRLAILLEHNEWGERYKSAARLKEAIGIYRSLGDKLKGTTVENNLPIALMWDGQFEELKKDLPSFGDMKSKTAFMLVALAATEGPSAAIQKAIQFESTEDARRNALRAAGNTLIKLRMYPQGAELLKAGAKGISNAAEELSRAALLSKTRKYEDVKNSDSSPQSVLYRVLGLLVAPEPREEDLISLLSRFSINHTSGKQGLQELLKPRAAMRAQFAEAGMEVNMLADILFSTMELHTEGDDATGYKVSAQAFGEKDLVLFVTKEENRYVLIGSGDEFEDVGKLILELLKTGEIQKARTWLDRAREQLTLTGGDDPISGRAFPRLWTKGQSATLEQMQLAAAALISNGEDASIAVPILLKAQNGSPSDALRTSIDLALLEAYQSSKKWEEAMPVARRLLAAAPNSKTAFLALAGLQIKAKRWVDCERLANDRLNALPNDLEALRIQRSVAEAQSDWKQSALIGKRILESGKAEYGDYNAQAWNTLFNGSTNEEALQAAQKSALLSRNKKFSSLHTLASIEAELGHTAEAREVLLRAMQVDGLEEPNSQCWYVLGRIAEQFGELEAALNAYKKVTVSETKEIASTDIYELAQKRMKNSGSPSQ